MYSLEFVDISQWMMILRSRCLMYLYYALKLFFYKQSLTFPICELGYFDALFYALSIRVLLYAFHLDS